MAMHDIFRSISSKRNLPIFLTLVGVVFIASVLISGIIVFGKNNAYALLPSNVDTCKTSAIPTKFGEKPVRQRADVSAAALDGTSRKISNIVRAYNTATGAQKTSLGKQLKELAKTRKDQLVEAMRQNPDAAILDLLTVKERTALLSLTSNCVEAPVILDGSLEVIHSDNFQDSVTETQYTLITAKGERILLHPARGLRVALESRTRVRVSGFRIDNDLIFDGMASLAKPFIAKSGIDVISQPGNPPVLGDQKTIVIMANFQNTTQPTLPTLAQVQDVVFNQANSFYLENSYNNVSLSGDVQGWYTITTNYTCDYFLIRSKTIQAADPFVDFRNYSRLVIIITNPNCGWAGVGTIGKEALLTADGQVTMSTAWVAHTSTGLRTVGHELGHNFGNHHARFLNCGSVSVPPGSCTSSEYGDPYDILGGAYPAGHFNAPHKEYVGWFDPSNFQTITANGTYIIKPIETLGSGLKGIRIPRSASDYLYAEYRQPIGYDAGFSGTDVYDGSSLHITPSGPFYPQLIDPSPPGNANTSTLKVGETFTDPNSNSSLTVVSKNSSGVTVDVVLGQTDFTGPTVSLTSPTDGSTVSGTNVTLTASATDPSGVDRVEFYGPDRTGFYSILIATDTVAPYTTTWDTTYVPNGSAWLYAKAYDTHGNVSFSISKVVTVANTDSTLPTVTLTSPTNGSSVANPVTFSATASDNIGIWKVEFYTDERSGQSSLVYMVGADYDAPYELSVFLSENPHIAYAIAYDYVGNSVQTPTASFTVVPPFDTIAPSVAITDPINGAYIRSIIPIAVTASDNVGVSRVEFYRDNIDILDIDFSEPFTILWNSTTVSDGAHTLWADAYDAAGNKGTSPSISVTVDNTLPTGAMTAPSDGATVSGNNITISAAVSDNIAVERVDFYRDSTILVDTDTTSPYSIIWDSTTVTNGDHTLFAKVVDRAGNTATLASRTVTVNNSLPDTTRPTVSITSPINGSNVTRNTTVTISASASDNVGVTRVEFYVNNVLTCSDATSPYSCAWRVPTPNNRTYSLLAKAYDTAGNVGTSTTIQVTAR